MKETNKLLAIYLLIIAAVCFSCNPVKRVLADIDKVKQVRTATDDLFPCINDSIFTTKTDTLTTYDTTVITKDIHNTDTIIHVKDCPVKVVTKTVRIKDTVTIVTKDGREEKRLQDDLDLAIQRMIAAQQETIKAKDEADRQRKAKNLFMWILIAIGVIGVGGFVLKLKSWKK